MTRALLLLTLAVPAAAPAAGDGASGKALFPSRRKPPIRFESR